MTPNRVARSCQLPAPTPPTVRVRSRRFNKPLARRSSNRIALGLAPQVFHAEQPLRFQPRVGQGLLHGRGSGHVPMALAAGAMLDRRLQVHAQVQQMLDVRAHPAPPFPLAHAHAPSDPVVQLRERSVALADAEMRSSRTRAEGIPVEPSGYAAIHAHRSRCRLPGGR